MSENMPLAGGFWNEFVMVDGGVDKALANFARVDGDFFTALDIPVVRGRPFSSTDSMHAPPVALVNETFAAQATGRRRSDRTTRCGSSRRPASPTEEIQIIGVTRDTKYGAFARIGSRSSTSRLRRPMRSARWRDSP